jgi:hypothetical protein
MVQGNSQIFTDGGLDYLGRLQEELCVTTASFALARIVVGGVHEVTTKVVLVMEEKTTFMLLLVMVVVLVVAIV